LGIGKLILISISLRGYTVHESLLLLMAGTKHLSHLFNRLFAVRKLEMFRSEKHFLVFKLPALLENWYQSCISNLNFFQRPNLLHSERIFWRIVPTDKI